MDGELGSVLTESISVEWWNINKLFEITPVTFDCVMFRFIFVVGNLYHDQVASVHVYIIGSSGCDPQRVVVVA